MRNHRLVLLLSVSLSLPLLPGLAADPQLPANGVSLRPLETPDFWGEAAGLVQDQLNLIDGIEKAIAGPDLNRVEAMRSRLILQSGNMQRFLQSRYRIPRLLCNNGTASPEVVADLTLPQRQVYCALYSSTQQLKPVVAILERRLPMLAGLAAPHTLPGRFEPLWSAPLNFQNPVLPRFSPVPDLPVPEAPVVGFPGKTPMAEFEPPFQPALKPPIQATIALGAARQQLLKVLPVFPTSIRIFDPAVGDEISDRLNYGISPLEPLQYRKFLSQPHTGITRLLRQESYYLNPNQLRNRLEPTVAERFPFVPLGISPSGLIPRLALEIADDHFKIVMPGLNYGFMVNLGEVSLENLDTNLENLPTLSPRERELFLNYSPPQQLAAVQLQQRRFLTGKEPQELGVFPTSLAPVVLNHTYLLRLFQFQVPEVILKRQPVSREDRRYLDQILEMPSSDVLVAIQPVSRRFDGSYTVLWRLLNQFPDPRIIDLEKYVELD